MILLKNESHSDLTPKINQISSFSVR
ncbi:unnamed protein product, partial [Rotaria magnacalcarata]